MLISVIVTTYNRPDALLMVLQGLSRQSHQQFEVLVADDGSTTDTQSVITDHHWPFPIKHVWHEDRGFRAATIRNLAAKQASGEYLIFIDGDCIPRTNFIQAHQLLAETGWFVSGSRVLLNPELTQDVLCEKQKMFNWTPWQWLLARIKGRINRLLPLINLPLFPTKNRSGEWRGAKTCNLAIWRDDFFRIDGFDEAYTGWGYEDSDLVVRLLQAKLKRKLGKQGVTVLHLWHPENDRQHEGENWERLNRRINLCKLP